MGVPKCFNFLGCMEVTLILRDYKTVTGKIIGDFDDRKKLYWADKDDDNKNDDCCDKNDKHECDCDHDSKHDEKHCKPSKVDVKVDVDDKCDFILLELTRDAESVNLQRITTNGGLEVEWANVEFRKGSCIAVNVCDIIYVGINAEIDEEELEFSGVGAAPCAE